MERWKDLGENVPWRLASTIHCVGSQVFSFFPFALQPPALIFRQRLIEVSLSSGNYSRLLADVQFTRSMGYYMIQASSKGWTLVLKTFTGWLLLKPSNKTPFLLNKILLVIFFKMWGEGRTSKLIRSQNRTHSPSPSQLTRTTSLIRGAGFISHRKIT